MAKMQQCKNRKGLSTIVVTLLLIALSMAAIVVVWGFVSNILNKQISSSEACTGNFQKIKLEPHYTCYDSATSSVRVSLSIGDIDVDKVIVSISSGSKIQSYTITNSLSTVVGIVPYPSGTQVILPAKNSGLTYQATGYTTMIDSIRIAPVIKGNQCDISDSLSQIEDCSLIV